MIGGWGGLSQFVVASSADEAQLRQMLPPNLRRSLQIRIQQPEVRLRPNRPHGAGGIFSAYDALAIENDLAHNAVLN